MKAEADLHFLQGINQLVGHGWPYSPDSAGEPGWRLYAAGAFNSHNPWLGVMPDLTDYLQRVSYALRQGSPANDVALLLPNDDVWASFVAGLQRNKPSTSAGGFDESGSNVTIDESLPRFLGHDVITEILDAGFNLDFIDADAIDAIGIPYKVLVLPNVDRIPPETYQRILDFAHHGGIVIATRRLPATAPGFENAAETSSRIQALSQTLFHGQIASAHFVSDEHGLGAQLAQWLHPDFTTSPPTPEIGFIHRHLDSGDLYFLANTTNRPHSFQTTFRSRGTHAEIWDPFTGKSSGLPDPAQIKLELQPYESRLVYFSNAPLSPIPAMTRTEDRKTDISHDWSVSFEGEVRPLEMHTLTSWPDDPHLRYYSGRASYRKTIDISAAAIRSGHSVAVDFGEGTPVSFPTLPTEFNMRAYLDSPVREAAQVYVNDKLAGYVWHPPFRVDLSSFVKSGQNELRIVVGNTAINELAGTALPNYRLLYARYGMEFQPQGMQDLQPLPSGILGQVNLIETGPAH
jgi:hypothetical protein